MAASGQFSWPPAGSFVAAYGQNLMAADNCLHRTLHSRVGLVEQKPDGCGIAIDFLDENGNCNLIRRHKAMLSRSVYTSAVLSHGRGRGSAGDHRDHAALTGPEHLVVDLR